MREHSPQEAASGALLACQPIDWAEHKLKPEEEKLARRMVFQFAGEELAIPQGSLPGRCGACNVRIWVTPEGQRVAARGALAVCSLCACMVVMVNEQQGQDGKGSIEIRHLRAPKPLS